MSCISSTDGVPMGATWAAVLLVGNVSGGTNPTLTAGDSLVALGDMTLTTGAFTTTFALATGLWTYPASATYASASPVVTVGDGTGAPNLDINKADASSGIINFRNVGVIRWQFDFFNTEDLYISRYTAAGVYQDSTILAQATHLWTYPGSATYTSATATVTVGGGGGAAQIILNQSADEVGSIEIQNASVLLNRIYFGAGAPAGVVNNGDFYFRMDNTGAGSAIYKYVGGAWANVA